MIYIEHHIARWPGLECTYRLKVLEFQKSLAGPAAGLQERTAKNVWRENARRLANVDKARDVW